MQSSSADADGGEPEHQEERLVCGPRGARNEDKHRPSHSDGAETLTEDAPSSLGRSREPTEQMEPSDVPAEDETRESSRSFALGYFTGKLSEAYRDARSFHFQHLSQKFSGVKVVFLHYAAKVTKELPLLHRLEPKHPAEAPAELGLDAAQPEVKGHAPELPQAPAALDVPGASSWPEGSVWFVRKERPEVFCQKLVRLPPALPQVTSLSPQQLLQQLQALVPQLSLGQPSGVFWLETASRQVPVQRPGFLLLAEKDLLVLSPGGPSEALSVDRFTLGELREVQVGLAGQLVRLLGCSDEAVLAVFTYSKELTQEFLRVLLRALCPDTLPEGIEGHPLLSGDLMLLSLDWRSQTPDVLLEAGLGLRLTSRFKRVLADLLYVVHGNMEGPDKPSLADTRPLLYTSVKVLTSSRPHPDDMCQLLLTETHVALLRQDGVFHPMSRGCARVPAPPHFSALQLRRRSEVGCVFVKRSDSWLVVDITFRPERRRDPRRSSLEAWPAPRCRGDSWQLCLGCRAEAVALIKHLCVSGTPGSGTFHSRFYP